ncbi:MAG: error-prone DNA polymerase [Myxococcota bacterium]
MGNGYVELQCASNFSFLRGASHPEELVATAASLGYRRLALTDHNGLYGVVRAYNAGKEYDVEIIPGVQVRLSGAGDEGLVLLPEDRHGWSNLTELLSAARLRTGKGGFHLAFDEIADRSEGLQAIHVGPFDPFSLKREHEVFGDKLSLSLSKRYRPDDDAYMAQMVEDSTRLGIPLVVTGGVLMHRPERKPLQDILSCIRFGRTLDTAGRRLLPHGSAYLKSSNEVRAEYRAFPSALERSESIADACRFRLDELKHNFTLEVLPEGETGMSYLRKLVERGGRERYPDGVPDEVRAQLEHELRLIDELDFSGYFLTVWDIVRFARSRGILCQGRGSAANSIVCYCLGITSIDPVRMSLLFERFISAERGEPPDIDVDFEHQRREDVMQYVFQKYGRHRAAMVANLIRYRGKLAYREVAKVFGLGKDQIDALTQGRGHWSSEPMNADQLRKAGLDPRDSRVQQVVRWAEELQGFPRHLGLHSGGFVITREPLVQMAPIENATMEGRTVVAWDKRDVETLGLVKVDLLALGMLSVVRRCFDYIRETEGLILSLADVPSEVPEVYDMISDADTIGTFQVESRAQMQTLPRLKPRTFYDLVVAVAIIRPGPIQGDMVHPYLRRREGTEAVDYPHPELEKILGRTYGLPLFQEQVMKMAVQVAGFTPGEADQLRRAIGWNSQVQIDRMRDRIIHGMLQHGLERAFAERIFKMIQGFGGYGFPESHAASFALIGYASCYLKRYHPAAFLCALLNSQPMGFYGPHTLVEDGKRHGLLVLPPSVTRSEYESRLELGSQTHTESWWAQSEASVTRSTERFHTPWADHVAASRGGTSSRKPQYGRPVQPAVRLGLKEVAKMSEAVAMRIVNARRHRPFGSVADAVIRGEIPKDLAIHLAACGAFSELGRDRRAAMWDAMSVDRSLPLLARAAAGPADHSVEGSASRTGVRGSGPGPVRGLREMNPVERMQADYGTMGLSTRVHPMTLLREEMQRRRILSMPELDAARDGSKVRVGGLVTIRQRPGTAKGVVFMTLEDEFGQMNLVIFPQVYERYRPVAKDAILLVARGTVQRRHRVTNVIVDALEAMPGPKPPEGLSRDFFDGRS